MIPALRIDYEQVSNRLLILKDKLDSAEGAEIVFWVDKSRECKMFFDLCYRQAIVSSGRFMQPGEVGNLPSGETYIVPYEGEKEAASRTEGVLPVQTQNSITFYQVKRNRARSVHGDGETARLEGLYLSKEPAYGNIAELGFGVLADFGVQPVQKILLDEKLGLHVGFGRSDHFGGFVGINQFSQPSNMVHVDHIYVPACQPRVSVKEVVLHYPDRQNEIIIQDDKYVLF
jgi:leucyl aminopeptidase (aminopeptidase T)